MKRSIGIPFLAWVGAAFLAHLMWTAGADRTLRVVERLGSGPHLSPAVGSDVSSAETIEVTLEDLPPEFQQLPDEAPPDELEVPSVPERKAPNPEPKLPEPIAQNVPEEPQRPNAPIQLFPSPSTPAQATPAAPAPEEPPPPPPPPPVQPPKDQRIAVRQHVQDKNQEDNPTARFLGDEANHVEEETVARITTHDQDDPDPTPGGNHSSPSSNPGNANETRIADSEDREGDPDKAPGEHVAENKEADPDKPPQPVAASQPPPAQPKAVSTPPSPAPAPSPPPATPGARANPEPPASPANPPTTDGPDPVAAADGAYSLDPRRKQKPNNPSWHDHAPRAPRPMGLGAGPNDRGVRTSLNMNDVVSTVGVDELSRQRAADGERRRSTHRGSWNASSLQRWRGAIENYVSSVRPGNQTALNTAQAPFSSYLNQIHNRLHPVFADAFLSSLDALPATHPMNANDVMTRLEIVVDPESGRVVKMGVIKTSGITAFDVAALDSVQRSSPFGKAPAVIVSTDGQVYLHWEFHRHPFYACSTMNAHPYMLNLPPKEDEPPAPPRTPRPPSDPQEQGAPPPGPPPQESGSRYGSRRPLRATLGS